MAKCHKHAAFLHHGAVARTCCYVQQARAVKCVDARWFLELCGCCNWDATLALGSRANGGRVCYRPATGVFAQVCVVQTALF
jgi:hypothetical protein